MPNKTCIRPTCNRAISGSEYGGLCIHHATAAGLAHHLVRWETIKPELDRLIDGGWAIGHLEREGRISAFTAREIRDHTRDRFQHRTLQSLKCTPAFSPYRRPTWPLARRVKALRAIGITYKVIANDLGYRRAFIQSIANAAHEWTSVESDQRIRAYYRKHHLDQAGEIDGRVVRARLPKPADWNNIDDPDEHATPSKRYDDVVLLRRKITPRLRQKTINIISHQGSKNAAMKLLKINCKTLDEILNADGATILHRTAERIAYQHAKLDNTTEGTLCKP